jgi:class 3 adenylate cyclase
MRDLDGELTLKIGIHEGPCIAVMLNDRLDFFGQTVNIASRVQGLATPSSILATGPVVGHSRSARLLESGGITPLPKEQTLRGIAERWPVFEIPQS